MKKLLIVLLSSICLLSCSNEDGPDPVIPPPAEKGISLSLAASIKPHEQATAVTEFKADDRIGVFYNDTCVNRPFTYDGSAWKGAEISLADKLMNLYCYFPYDQEVKTHDNITVDIEKQTDLLYGTAIVGTASAMAKVEMVHAQALVRLELKKNNYSGVGKVSSVTWNGLYKKARMNAITGAITPEGEKGTYLAGGNYFVEDSKDPVTVEAILLPVTTAEGISVTLNIDGEERTYQLPATHKWEAGKAYTYTLTLKGGYDSPIELEEYPLDITYWSQFGKTDQIVLGTSDKDWFDIEPGGVKYGTNIYQNEGYMFGFFGYWTGYDMATGDMPDKWEGEFRMVLMDDNENIVEQYQPCGIIAENGGMMKGTGRRSFVKVPAGSYELSVLFRKKGETTWIKANRKDKVTKQDMTFTVKEQTNLPALRMVQVEDEGNTGVVIHSRPYGSNFNITYILSNRGNIALKGEIKAVWERTFDYTGHCYRPSSKRTNTTNDNTWQDEIGRVSIDLQPTVRFWNGIIPCAFPVKREMPKTSNGIGYCTPMVHLYWKAEGSSQWVLLRCDLDEIMAAKVNTSQEEDNLFLKALNYISFVQSHWHN